MRRKDLFQKGIQKAFRFAFEKTDEITETIQSVWIDRPKESEKEKVEPPIEKTPSLSKEKKTKNRIFQSLALPPGAVSNFFEVCTGCRECIFACPYNALQPISLQRPDKSYPFLEVNAIACHLCSDWPCIVSCPEGALLPLPEQTNPKLGKAKGLFQNCLNSNSEEQICEACQSACPVEKTVQFRKGKPTFSPQTCTGCGLCVASCPTFPKAIQIEAKAWQE